MLEMVKTVSHSIQIANSVISTLKAQPEKMLAALTPEMLATEMADYLVRKGVPFREGHHVSGQVVVLAEKEGVPMVRRSKRCRVGIVDADFASRTSFRTSN